MMALAITVGWFANDVYTEVMNERSLDGMWVSNIDKDGVMALVQERDKMGDWVCVNINGMKYDRAVEVCKHEVGHEIFAEICEKDMDKCLGVVNG